MNLRELNEAAERHPWRWALVSGVALGLLSGGLWRSVSGGVLFGVLTFLIYSIGTVLKLLIRRRRDLR